MSERKTSEIKFRCTPSFKAEAQAAADAAGLSLTEHIEAAVRSHRNVGKADGVVGDIELALYERGLAKSGLAEYIRTNVDSVSQPLTPSTLDKFCREATTSDGAAVGAPIHPNLQPAESLPPLRPNTCGCKPWQFCACKANA